MAIIEKCTRVKDIVKDIEILQKWASKEERIRRREKYRHKWARAEMSSQINSKLACGKLLSWRYCPSLGLYAVWLAVLSLVFLLEIGLSSRIIQKKKRGRFATWNLWLSRKSKDSDPYVYFSKIIQCPKMIWALRQIVFPVWGCPQHKSWGTPPSCKEESLLSPPPWQPQWLFQDLLHIWRFMPLGHSSPSFWLHEFQSWRPCTEFFPNICF